MTSTTDTASTRDGIRLVVRHWAVDGTPRAATVFVHGLGEHSARYEHVGAQFAAAGIDGFAWDHRGFGASGGERAWIDAFDQLHDDVEDRLAAARAAVPGRRLILYGHSFGGLVSLGYCVSGRPSPDLLVLSAPGIGDSLPAWKHAAAPVLGRVAPHLRIAHGLTPEMLSKDLERQREAATDPLMVGTSTARFAALSFAEQPRVRAAAARLSIPTLVIHGLADPVVPASSSELLAGLPGVMRRTYPGARHELHNEAEGPAVEADVIAWIDARLAELVAGSSGPSATATSTPTSSGGASSGGAPAAV